MPHRVPHILSYPNWEWGTFDHGVLFFCFSKEVLVQMVKNLSSVWETHVQSLGPEDPMKKGMTIHSSIFAWRIPWTDEPGGLQSVRSQRGRCD